MIQFIQMIEVVIFDWKRTLYDPESQNLITGSLETLQYLGSRGIRLCLVGKDPVGNMPHEVDRLGVADYFTAINFVDDSKADEDIGRFIDPEHPECALVVGDRVRSEIEIANQLGAQTAWIRNGKFASELPQTDTQIPSYTLGAITELSALFDKLE